MEEINFDEMRNQIAILKNKLDNETIVNDRMMRQVLSIKADGIKRKQYISMACAVVTIILAPISFHVGVGASWYFVIGTDLLMAFCLYKEYMFKNMINNRLLMTENMLNVAERMSTFKRRYKSYTIFSMAVLLPAWILWLLAEIYIQQGGANNLFWGIAISLGIGLVIGATIGLWMFFRILNTADEIISQIKE